MSRFTPDLSGFVVEKLPSIEERLALPWDESYSIPQWSINWSSVENNEFKLVYNFKIRVFKRDINDWRLDVRGIAQSEFGGSFKTQKEALDKACEYLAKK